MLTTLKATVEGDKLRWRDLPDPPLPPHQPVEVLVTLVNGGIGAASSTQSLRRVAALKKLAALNCIRSIGARSLFRWD